MDQPISVPLSDFIELADFFLDATPPSTDDYANMIVVRNDVRSVNEGHIDDIQKVTNIVVSVLATATYLLHYGAFKDPAPVQKILARLKEYGFSTEISLV